MVDFTTPYLCEYLREHVASQVPGFRGLGQGESGAEPIPDPNTGENIVRREHNHMV